MTQKLTFVHFPLQPPENELQKARESNVALSEHQLRVQASLQKLNIPDWYKQYSGTPGHNTSVNTSYYNKSDVTGLLRKRNSDIGRWQGLSSKTTSLSSLGSNRSDRSPVMLSPSAHSHTGGPSTGFSRYKMGIWLKIKNSDEKLQYCGSNPKEIQFLLLIFFSK